MGYSYQGAAYSRHTDRTQVPQYPTVNMGTRKTATSKDKTGPKKPAQWEEQDPSHRHIHPVSHQIPCQHSDLAKGGHGGYRCEDLETPHAAVITEALITAAQEQAVSTRSIKAGVYHTRQGPRCRMCKEASETVQHIVEGCKFRQEHTEWHKQVAGTVYRNICAQYGLDPPMSRWETPQKVVENNRAKIM